MVCHNGGTVLEDSCSCACARQWSGESCDGKYQTHFVYIFTYALIKSSIRAGSDMLSHCTHSRTCAHRCTHAHTYTQARTRKQTPTCVSTHAAYAHAHACAWRPLYIELSERYLVYWYYKFNLYFNIIF